MVSDEFGTRAEAASPGFGLARRRRWRRRRAHAARQRRGVRGVGAESARAPRSGPPSVTSGSNCSGCARPRRGTSRARSVSSRSSPRTATAIWPVLGRPHPPAVPMVASDAHGGAVRERSRGVRRHSGSLPARDGRRRIANSPGLIQRAEVGGYRGIVVTLDTGSWAGGRVTDRGNFPGLRQRCLRVHQ